MPQPRTLSDFPSPGRKFPAYARRLIKGLAALAIFAVLGLAMLLALLWREHKTEITLPAPTGHFAVGRTTYAWVNNSQMDELAPSSGAKREVLVWIWYPSAAATSAAPVEYLPAPWRLALAQHSGVLMSQFFTRDLSLVRAHSTSDPEVSSEQRPYPVVIMRAGGGALTTDFTTLVEDLASHGYIVVGFDAPYRTFVVVLPDNRIVIRPATNNPENLQADQANRLINRLLPMWTSDTKFVVSQLEQLNAADPSGKFTGRLDMQRLGMFGHSFGGATALQFCHDDPQCKAGIDVDGVPYGSVVQDGLQQPFMFILSDHSHDLPDSASGQIHANFQSIYDRLPNGRLFITIRGANHFSFSDQMLLKSHYVIRLLRMFGFGGLDGRRGLTITADYVRTFFDVYLKEAPVALLNNPSQLYPEVQFVPP
ncbi:MAG: family ership [Candidatus Acidoferrum typicum]|nr:family ership [Candidatus Acidoferrum typicum]